MDCDCSHSFGSNIVIQFLEMSDDIVDYCWDTWEGHRYFQILFESGWIFWFLGLQGDLYTNHSDKLVLYLLDISNSG